MAELELCPFCGGEAEKMTSSDGFTSIGCLHCNPVFGVMIQARTEAEAIAAWNTRAAMSYEDVKILLDKLGVSERTCELICHEVELPDSLKDADFEMYVYECSECGEPMFSDYNYCPNCGAKVVS